jgi:hypothetical protein
LFEGLNKAMMTPTPDEIAKRIVRHFIQSGAKAGDLRHPRDFPGGISMPGKIADWKPGLDYAVEQGWLKQEGEEYRLTDPGYAAGK